MLNILCLLIIEVIKSNTVRNLIFRLIRHVQADSIQCSQAIINQEQIQTLRDNILATNERLLEFMHIINKRLSSQRSFSSDITLQRQISNDYSSAIYDC